MDILTAIGTLSDFGGAIAAVASAAGLVVSLRTRRDLAHERAKAQESIQVELLLVSEQKTRSLPLHMRRAELTRAELLGRIGMVPMREPGKRFALAYLSKEEFLLQLATIQDGNGSRIVIPCSDTEFEQFAV